MLCTFIFVISLSGCKKDSMEDITIYTTTYPVEYINSKLYGEYSNVSSIYPNEVIKITDKLIRMKEAEAHYKNGWVTVQGAGNTVVDATEK